ncbi:hypothetical protein [Marinobacter mangrovi]|uniref:hypothetical protein n=1 Tax=Marinobacter mangrovi TaxID=2803918 RepID=UPI0019343532|nr:hypothetical protein [Marinobacter mangrovi]
MSVRMIAVAMLLPVCAVAGEQGGVKSANGEVGAGYTNSRDSDRLLVNGAYRLPLAEYVGAILSASASRTEMDVGDYDVDSTDGSVGGSLFARDYGLGKVGVSYHWIHGDNEVESSQVSFVNSSSSFKAHAYGAFASYYLDRITLSASRSVSHVESQGTGNYNSWSVGATGYLPFDASLSLSAGGMDARDNYGFNFEYQPEFLAQAASVELSYSSSPDDDVFGIAVNYFFGNDVPLIVRDRQYR